MKYRYAIAACARWETPYIVEWLNYHRAIGFDHVFLYCNDDEPAALYEQVLPFTQGHKPFVTFRYHPHQGEQARMYLHFLQHNLHECAWVSFFDIDEFLHLPPGETIGDFMARFEGKVDCVLFNWIFFGPNGHKQPPGGSVLANYTRRSGNLHPLTKYVARSSVFAAASILDLPEGKSFWHSPENMAAGPINIVNVLGEDARDYYAAFDDAASPFVNQWPRKSRILATAFIQHHAFRSESAFWDRSKRGLKGGFEGQTAWRELAESESFAPFLEEVNGIEDTRLATFWRAHIQQRLQTHEAEKPALKLGIAITTLNRRDMVLSLVTKIQALTKADYELVVCDDGSTDGTIPALEAAGVTVIGGTPRGIAWNKNRGIYDLLHVRQCDVIILLDDDITPVTAGWEAEWIDLAWRHGHVNYALPAFQSSLIAGTGAGPGLSSLVPGTAFAFSRIALAQIGYLDVRFGRYGHEHSDFSYRALRAGFGGIKVMEGDWNAPYFYVITGGLETVQAVTSGTQEELTANFRLLGEVANDPIYRHAWLTDESRSVFLAEIEAGGNQAALRLKNNFSSWRHHAQGDGHYPGEPAVRQTGIANLALRKPATQSSVSEWSTCPMPAQDAAGAVNGRADGRRKFHTALEHNPWWQVDLGGFATIHEIHIYNTTEPTAGRFTNFSLAVSIEGEIWMEIFAKQDDTSLGVPFIWNGPGTAWGRFVRVTLLGTNYLHLDQVEVYGTPS
jgi:hypothetical protein